MPEISCLATRSHLISACLETEELNCYFYEKFMRIMGQIGMYSIIGRKNKRKKKFSIEKQANILAQYTQAKLASTVIFNPLPTELEEAKISVNH